MKIISTSVATTMATLITLALATSLSATEAKPLGTINGKPVTQPADTQVPSRTPEAEGNYIRWSNKPKGWKPPNPMQVLK